MSDNNTVGSTLETGVEKTVSQTSVEKLFAQSKENFKDKNGVPLNVISLVGNIKPLPIGFRSGKAQLEKPLTKYVAAKFTGSMDELQNLNDGGEIPDEVKVTVVNSKDEKIVNITNEKDKYKNLIDVHKLTSQFAANRESGGDQITDIDGTVNKILKKYDVDNLIFRSTTFNSSVNFSGSQLLFIYKKDNNNIVNGSGYLYYVLSAQSIQGMLGRNLEKFRVKGQSKVIIKPFTIKDNVINTEILADPQGVNMVHLLKNLTGAPLRFGNPFGSIYNFLKGLDPRQKAEIVKEADQLNALVKTGSDQDVVKSKSNSMLIWRAIVMWWYMLPFKKALIEKIQKKYDCNPASQAIDGQTSILKKFKNDYKTCYVEYKNKLMGENGELKSILEKADYLYDANQDEKDKINSQTKGQYNSIRYYAPDTEFYKMYMGYYEQMGSDEKIKESLCYWGQWWKSAIASVQTAFEGSKKRFGPLLSSIGTYIPNVSLSKTIEDWGGMFKNKLYSIIASISSGDNKAIANNSDQSQNSNLPSSVVEADDNDSGTNNNGPKIEEIDDGEEKSTSEVIGNAMEQERQNSEGLSDPLSITDGVNQERTNEVPPEERGQQNVMRGLNSLGNSGQTTDVDNNDDQRPSTTTAPPVTSNKDSTPGLEMEMVPLKKELQGGRKRKVTRKNSKKIKIASKSKKPKKIKGKRISIKKKFSKTKHKKK